MHNTQAKRTAYPVMWVCSSRKKVKQDVINAQAAHLQTKWALSSARSVDLAHTNKELVEIAAQTVKLAPFSPTLARTVASRVRKVDTVMLPRQVMVASLPVLLGRTTTILVKAILLHVLDVHLGRTVQRLAQKVSMPVCRAHLVPAVVNQVGLVASKQPFPPLPVLV